MHQNCQWYYSASRKGLHKCFSWFSACCGIIVVIEALRWIPARMTVHSGRMLLPGCFRRKMIGWHSSIERQVSIEASMLTNEKFIAELDTWNFLTRFLHHCELIKETSRWRSLNAVPRCCREARALTFDVKSRSLINAACTSIKARHWLDWLVVEKKVERLLSRSQLKIAYLSRPMSD